MTQEGDMSEERIRPVPGDIILPGLDRTQRVNADASAAEIVDAEFETLRPNRSERLLPPDSGIGTAAVLSQGLDTLRKRDGRVTTRARTRGGPIFWTVGLGLAVGAFWVSGGHALVRQSSLMPRAPQTQPANPLRISDVVSKIEQHGERRILLVDGKAINDGGLEHPVPPIEISVTANDDRVVRYKLGTSHEPLAAGSEFSFSSRFEAPKEGVRSVSVAFRE
jgi:hypothetical protein